MGRTGGGRHPEGGGRGGGGALPPLQEACLAMGCGGQHPPPPSRPFKPIPLPCSPCMVLGNLPNVWMPAPLSLSDCRFCGRTLSEIVRSAREHVCEPVVVGLMSPPPPPLRTPQLTPTVNTEEQPIWAAAAPGALFWPLWTGAQNYLPHLPPFTRMFPHFLFSGKRGLHPPTCVYSKFSERNRQFKNAPPPPPNIPPPRPPGPRCWGWVPGTRTTPMDSGPP